MTESFRQVETERNKFHAQRDLAMEALGSRVNDLTRLIGSGYANTNTELYQMTIENTRNQLRTALADIKRLEDEK